MRINLAWRSARPSRRLGRPPISIDIGKALRTAASKPGAFAEARVVAECTV